MNDHDPKLPDDSELEDFLAGRGPLSRAHRESAQEQAPPELDAKVLQAAREELRQSRRPRRLLRWDSPLALAASMVLVLGLGWLTQYRVAAPVVRGELSAAPAPAAALPPRQESAESDKAVADEQKAAASAAPQQIVTNGPVAMSPAAPASGSNVYASASPAREQPRAKDEAPAASQPPLKKEAVAPAKPAPPPRSPPVLTSQAAPSRDAAPAAAAPPVATGNLAEKPSALAAQQQRDSLEQRERAQDQAQAAMQKQKRPAQAFQEPMPPSPFPAAPPPPAAAADMDQRATNAAPAPAPVTNSVPGAGMNVQSARVADPCASPQRAPAQRQAQPEQHQDSPQWLEQIRQLRQSDESAARTELACFVARRSPAEVPEDLQQLLPR